MQSIHGQAIAQGQRACAGVHGLPRDPLDQVACESEFAGRGAECFARHVRALPRGRAAEQEFGVPGNRVTSYFDSYHGLAAEGGSVVAANCSSCHGVHNILPSSDPRSTINKANLDATCGKCHKGVTQKFTQTRCTGRRRSSNDIGSIAVRWVRWFTLLLIVAGDWRHVPAQRDHLAQQGGGAARMQNPSMTRMTTNQRWQHLILLTSFIVLVITGFALKFPNSWFARCWGWASGCAALRIAWREWC
jgi:hypothetical protein